MKKVLFICSLYHPHVGGIETMITELSQFYRKQGIESVILTKKWPTVLAEEDEYKNTKIYRVISARTDDDFFNVSNWIKSNEEKIKADIIHVIGVRRPLPVFGLLLSRLWNVPLISTIAGSEIPHTGDPETYSIWDEGKDLMRPVIEASNLVTCVSRALENDLQKIVPNIKLLRTIYAGIDIKLINLTTCVEIEKNYIVSLRRLIPSKGIDVLIKAFKDIVKEYPQVKLIIAGDGSEEANLKFLVKNLELEDKIKFIGTVSMERCISLLKGALCTVVPSLSEGGGLVNVEAQAASCPVVASRVGGIPEYVEDTVSGLLFEAGNYKDLAEKLRKILSNDSLKNKLIKGGIRHAKKFSWDMLGPQYLALYDEMINIRKVETFKPWSDLVNKLWLNLRN
ncbi:MAG: glycosyltransferase family 4 protein [Candidatus Levybacteria bacterium]|nr:glycosyltransferase family 4 protein [Candidatus Levybacteria bacterium]